VEAVDLIAREGWALLEDYRFDLTSGLWRHRAGPVEPPVRLADLHYDATGSLVFPHHDDRADEGVLRDHLAQGRDLLERARLRPHGPDAHLPPELAHLQWFELPEASLSGSRS
jgi:hypothetical protein